ENSSSVSIHRIPVRPVCERAGRRPSRTEGEADGQVHADHASAGRCGVRRRFRLQRDARDGRTLQRRTHQGRCPAGRRRPRRPGRRSRRRFHRRDARGDRRPVWGDEGTVRRLLHPRRRLEGRGGGMDQADAAHRRLEDRGSPSDHDRRVSSGQRVDPEGTGVARGDRTTLSTTSPGSPGTPEQAARRAVEAVWRMESARIVGGLARFTGDFSRAEDLAQEAVAEALVSWPVNGIPDDPRAWLSTVGRRRAIDTFRRRSNRDAKYAQLIRDMEDHEPGIDAVFDPEAIDDDILALMFVACHPVLSKESRIALTLRTVAGLSSDAIAKAFLVPTATIQARITRAKKT